ncbi:MAG: hypothetical protein C0617_08005 [Desulfuromonas sp.]|uniref:hypothetical protein n=1 Tax=Desulfuromonas sp. TaxID=892 RepID=UPI000CC0A805|nr:hypothetical protein [Desulfuromonas sp.]PLX84419.1 MAG: hypothetical protein C0617_08005 [Desulfuromonas sp.]
MNQNTEAISLIKKSRLFDEDWYLEQYPDVALLSMDPVEHYLRIGAFIGRDPSPMFSTTGYLQAHPDVKNAGLNPLHHYVKWGRREGRPTLQSQRPWEDRSPFDEVAREPSKGATVNRGQTSPSSTLAENQTRSAEMEGTCRELRKENEMLLLQLHQVQKELEEHVLKCQGLAAKSTTFS